MNPPRKVSFWKRQRYRLDAALLFSLVWVFERLGLDRAGAAGAWLGRHVLGPILRRPHELTTLRTAFPDLAEAELERIREDMWANVGRVIAEVGLLDQFGGPEGRKRFTIEGYENVAAARQPGREPIIVSGHFANWEVAFVAGRHLGIEFAGVVRPPNNPWVAKWIADKRARVGMTTQIPKGPDGTRQLFATIRQGKAIGLMIDQHLAEGIPVPLFGVEAMTTHAPATFARKLGVPVLPVGVRRLEGSHFRIIFHPPQWAANTDNAERDILELTTALNRFVEGEVRASPAHWLWMHQRFKPVEQLTRRAKNVVSQAEPTP